MHRSTNADTPWLVTYDKKPDAKLRLFCFHYGGGSASAFRRWSELVPEKVELVAVQLPGREGRFSESFVTDFDELVVKLVDVLKPYLDKPYVVFGHSLGTIKSFEWIRALKDRSLRQPLLYVPSGMPAPQCLVEKVPISSLPEANFIKELLKSYGDTLKNVLENDDLKDVFIPQLRADFKLLENYQYKQGKKIDCPIFAFAGENEPDISEQALKGWAAHTKGKFRKRRFAGDHFFIHSSESRVLEIINSELLLLLSKFKNFAIQTK